MELDYSLHHYQKPLMIDSKNKSILFSSQSFYPAVGGVSTLLLSLSKYLIKLNYNIYSVHLQVSNDNDSINKLGLPIKEYIIPKSGVPESVFAGYAKFKEVIYQHLHGVIPFKYSSIEEVPGYLEYMKLSEIYSYYLIRVLTENDIDIVHFHDYQVMPGLSVIPFGIKSVFSMHAPFLDSVNPIVGSWIRRYCNGSNKTIFSIPNYANVALKHGIKAAKVRVIPPIINKEMMDRSREKIKALNNISNGSIVISCIQRFDSKSGQIQLIKAFSKVFKKHKNIYLVLVGGSSFTDNISNIRKNYLLDAKNLVNRLNISNNVIFTGSVDYTNLSYIYDKSDIVAMLSIMECFGLAISEAIYKGKPVIVTNVGGLDYQIINGKSGYKVEVGNIDNTAEALSKLIESKKMRESFGIEGKKRFSNLFDPLKIVPKYHFLYQSLFSNLNINDLDYEHIYNLLR